MRIGNLSTCGRGFFLALSAARHARGHRVHYVRRKFGPRLGSVALALGVQCRTHELPLCHGVAFRRARVKQNDGNPHKRNETQQVFGCSAYNSSHIAWSPSHLTPRAWVPGHPAPRLSSLATALTLRAPFIVPHSTCSRMTKGNISQTAVQTASRREYCRGSLC